MVGDLDMDVEVYDCLTGDIIKGVLLFVCLL